MEIEICKFQLAWIGRCKNSAVENGMCEKHKNLKCISCGAPATHQCSETGQFVCGYPLCDDCEHTNAIDGTNGGIGFFRISSLPEGMKEHCKKSDQKEFPWIVHSIAKDYSHVRYLINKFKKGKLTYLETDKLIGEYVKQKNKEEGLD